VVSVLRSIRRRFALSSEKRILRIGALGLAIAVAGSAIAAFALTRGVICDDPAIQTNAATDGSFAVWEDQRGPGGGTDIWGRDLDGAEERVISDAEGEQRAPKVSEGLVVWEDERNNPGTNEFDIYCLDLDSGEESSVSTETGTQVNPDVSGDLIVWQDHRNGDADIYLRDMTTGIESEVCTATGDQTDPAISGTRVVWTDGRSAESHVFIRDVATSEPETRVADVDATQWSPDVSGDRVAWIDVRGGGDSTVYLKTLGGGPAESIATSGSFINDVSLSDRLVAWHLDEAQGWIKGYDLTTGELLDLAGGPRDFVNQPHVGGQVVVWSDYGDEDRADIHGLSLEIDDQTPPETRLEGLDDDAQVAEGEPIELLATDPGIFVSGVERTLYRLDDAPEATYTESLLPELGEHRIVYWSVDASGNVEAANEEEFTVVAQEETGPAEAASANSSLPTTGSEALVVLPVAGLFALLGTALRRLSRR